MGGDTGASGGLSLVVEGERVVLPDDPEVITILGLELLDGALDASAEGALVLREDHQGDGGRNVAPDGRVADRDKEFVGGIRTGGCGRLGLSSLKLEVGLHALAEGVAERLSALGEGLHLLDFRVDDGLEGIKGLRARDGLAVDEEVRGPLDARLAGVGKVLGDGILVGVLVEGFLELDHVEANLGRILLEVRTGERLHVVE